MSWVQELGDRVLDMGNHKGIEWVIARAPVMGAVNGYVRLPEGHPWLELDLQFDDAEEGPEVHGGITYGPTKERWIGFDTAHAFDIWPNSPDYLQEPPHEYDIHWTENMVVAETKRLAEQAKEALDEVR